MMIYIKKHIRLFAVLLAAILVASVPVSRAFSAYSADSDSIGQEYKVAIDQMSELGVLNGFPDGSFQPNDTLTREQGAEIVAYMVLGNEVGTLTCEKAPFSDVTADRWSAPCIAWCVEQQILQGYEDGSYKPEDTLTGNQFAGMLLCALDLAEDDSYVGSASDMHTAVMKDAEAAGLYTGDASMATDQPITHQQAVLMAWNARKAVEASMHVDSSVPVLIEESAVPSAAPTDAPSADSPENGETEANNDNETSMMTDF